MWKLGLGLACILAVISGGVYLAGQYVFQEELTALPEQDELPAQFAVEHEEPPEVENIPGRSEEEGVIPTAAEADDSEADYLISEAPKDVGSPDANAKDEKKPDVPAPASPETIPPPVGIVPFAPLTEPPVASEPNVPLPKPPVAVPPVPNLDPPLPPTPTPPPINLDIPRPAPVPAPVQQVVNCPWNIQLQVIKGRTILTAKAGKEASFRIECDQVDLQAPKGCLRASGKVKISGPGLEGTSNIMTLNLQEDRLMLEGNVKVKSRRDNQDLELTGERLNLRLINKSAEATKVGLDFGFPTLNSPDDSDQIFSFWEGLFR